MSFNGREFIKHLLFTLLFAVCVGMFITGILVLVDVIHIAPRITETTSIVDGSLGNINSGLTQIKQEIDYSPRDGVVGALIGTAAVGVFGGGFGCYAACNCDDSIFGIE